MDSPKSPFSTKAEAIEWLAMLAAKHGWRPTKDVAQHILDDASAHPDLRKLAAEVVAEGSA